MQLSIPINKSIYLKDLILIQQQRLCAYEHLVKWVENSPATSLLGEIITRCRNSVMELRSCLDEHHDEPAGKEEHRGEVYQVWAGIKEVMPGCSEREILMACEYNERATCLVYRKVLSKRGIFCHEQRKIFSVQLQQLEDACKSFQDIIHQPFQPAGLERPCPDEFVSIR